MFALSLLGWYSYCVHSDVKTAEACFVDLRVFAPLTARMDVGYKMFTQKHHSEGSQAFDVSTGHQKFCVNAGFYIDDNGAFLHSGFPSK